MIPTGTPFGAVWVPVPPDRFGPGPCPTVPSGWRGLIYGDEVGGYHGRAELGLLMSACVVCGESSEAVGLGGTGRVVVGVRTGEDREVVVRSKSPQSDSSSVTMLPVAKRIVRSVVAALNPPKAPPAPVKTGNRCPAPPGVRQWAIRQVSGRYEAWLKARWMWAPVPSPGE